MKLLVVLCLVVAVTAAPQQSRSPDADAQILKYYNDVVGFGGYKYGFDQSNGFQREEVGEIRNEGREDEYLAVKGSYSYVGSDGVNYRVKYVADDNGFQPDIEQGPGGGVPIEVLNTLLSG